MKKLIFVFLWLLPTLCQCQVEGENPALTDSTIYGIETPKSAEYVRAMAALEARSDSTRRVSDSTTRANSFRLSGFTRVKKDMERTLADFITEQPEADFYETARERAISDGEPSKAIEYFNYYKSLRDEFVKENFAEGVPLDIDEMEGTLYLNYRRPKGDSHRTLSDVAQFLE